jgi:hypothetical protein
MRADRDRAGGYRVKAQGESREEEVIRLKIQNGDP